MGRGENKQTFRKTFPKTKCALIRKIVVKYSRKDRVEVPDLLRNLARNLIGSYRVFIRLLAKAKIKASEHEGERDSKPKAEQCHHCGEWNLAWGEGKREALNFWYRESVYMTSFCRAEDVMTDGHSQLRRNVRPR